MSVKIRTLPLAGEQQSVLARSLQFGIMLALGNLALITGAHVEVPFWPVPMTMETFAVLAIGLSCTRRLALAAVGAFLLEGLIGLPVFAQGGGALYILGPTGGYLLGYPVAVALLAEFKKRGWYRSGPRLILALTAADAAIFAAGFAWLAVLIGLQQAWFAGVAPFLLGDALKIALVAVSARIADRALRHRQT